MELYFFLSYARSDDRSAFVVKFYNDLLKQLDLSEFGSPDQPAFLDQERILLGADWGRTLGDAVGHCRSMLALYSPAYFRSVYCGKEWSAFRERLLQYRAETDIDARALIPVLWEPVPGPLPDDVVRIQYAEPSLGADYARHGLLHLLRTDPAGSAYRKVVEVIADRIRLAASRFRLPTVTDLDLERVSGCFPVDRVESPGHVQVFLAAVTVDSTPPGRRCQDYYGREPRDWSPYHPPARPTIAHRAQRVIVNEGHTTSLEVVDQDLSRKLDAARENNQTSVLLVDAWAARVTPYRVPLTDYDAHNHPVTGVLVPCDEADEESGPQNDELWQDLRQVFSRNWVRRIDDPMFRLRVGRDEFDGRLAVMVTVAQNRLMDHGTPRRLPAGPPPPPLPGLTVPADQGLFPAPGEGKDDGHGC